MDHARPQDDARVAAVAEMLELHRPVPTFDELDRVSRRLTAARAARRTPRRWSRLAVIVCLSVGLIFATAGTGLAISGFATPGPSVSAQYPDSTSTATPLPASSETPSPTSGGKPVSDHGKQHNTVSPSTLGQVASNGNRATRYVSLVHAETGNQLPFTGFAAIPVLIAGIALLLAGAMVHRRTSAS